MRAYMHHGNVATVTTAQILAWVNPGATIPVWICGIGVSVTDVDTDEQIEWSCVRTTTEPTDGTLLAECQADAVDTAAAYALYLADASFTNPTTSGTPWWADAHDNSLSKFEWIPRSFALKIEPGTGGAAVQTLTTIASSTVKVRLAIAEW